MSEIWTIKRVLDWTKSYLAEKGVENARLESEWMLTSVTGHDRVGLYVNFDQPLTDSELARYRGMVGRRSKREPLQYILGSQEFYGLDFMVSPEVLIPRHDTEVLVEEALRLAPDARRVLDIGTGSGCIAVVLAKHLPLASVAGVDVSPKAIAVALLNAEKNGVPVDFREGSIFEPVAGDRFDLIVSNPPYIPRAVIGTLEPEVHEYEPLMALDGGEDGLDFYRLISSQAQQYLNQFGWLIVEVGVGQAGAVKLLFESAGFSEVFVANDPGGIERVVGGRICQPRHIGE